MMILCWSLSKFLTKIAPLDGKSYFFLLENGEEEFLTLPGKAFVAKLKLDFYLNELLYDFLMIFCWLLLEFLDFKFLTVSGS